VICEIKDFALEQVDMILKSLNSNKNEEKKADVKSEEKGATDVLNIQILIERPQLCAVDNAGDLMAEAFVTNSTIKFDMNTTPNGQVEMHHFL